MKKILIFIMILSTLLIAVDSDTQKKDRVKKQIEKEMEKEKKYAREQTFYSAENYDFKGAEVNPDSLSSVPEIKVDDFNIDSVYD